MDVNLCDVKVGDPIWAMQNQDDTVDLRLDCGDAGFIKLTLAQATDMYHALEPFINKT